MRKFIFYISFIAFLAVGCQSPPPDEPNGPAKPNILFILTDDLGYGDLGVLFQNQREQEGKPFHRTPFLDSMAQEGVLLTRHYVPAPVCAPSRASLLQGVHQGHAQVRNNQFDKALTDNHNLATVLKEAGYATALIGKYGLQGKEGDSPESWEAYPTKRGFDHFFGYVRHRDGHNHYPAHEAPARPPVELYADQQEISDQLKGCYTTDLFSAAAKKWIIDKKQSNPNQPFFLYLAYDTPHAGLQVAAAPYPEGGGLNGGVQWIGEPGNFINTVEDSIDDYIHPDYSNQDWPDTQKRFASMVRRIDSGVGDIRQLLRDLEIDQNTLVVFSSDNGPHRESYGYGDYSPTFFDSYGPLDGIKRDTWEGGIRVSTFAWWPGNIPAAQENSIPSGFHDWLPTFAELGGVPAPANTDGVSLVPLLTGNSITDSSLIYIEYEVGRATPEYPAFDATHAGQKRGQMQVTYLDGYKGVRYNIQDHHDDFRIYDTEKDPGEANNLAGSTPYFRTLQQKLKDHVLRVRRPNNSASRPYDSIPIPAIVSGDYSSGLQYRAYEMTTPWAPHASSIKTDPKSEGTSETFDLSLRTRENNVVLIFSGLLQVPVTGKYIFTVASEGNVVCRIHQATIIDADKMYQYGDTITEEVYLEQGFHPVHLIYRNGLAGTPDLQLQWSGPGFSLQSISPDQLFH